MTALAYRALRFPGTLGVFAAVSLGGVLWLSGCSSDEPGSSKTTTKTTVETPTEKTTTTETHTKDTTIHR